MVDGELLTYVFKAPFSEHGDMLVTAGLVAVPADLTVEGDCTV
jgi:hypothetical protein